MIYFFLIEIAFLASPFLGYLLYKKFYNDKKIILCLLGSISILSLGWYFDITFKGDIFDFLLPISLYITYCYLVFSLFQVQNKLVRITTCFIASLPIMVGYLVATVGLLGLIMISTDFESHRTVTLSKNTYFREYVYGNVTTEDGGMKIDVYEYLTWFPIFEKKIFSKQISIMRYEINDLKIKLTPTLDKYKIQIYSKDSLQIDTTIEK